MSKDRPDIIPTDTEEATPKKRFPVIPQLLILGVLLSGLFWGGSLLSDSAANRQLTQPDSQPTALGVLQQGNLPLAVKLDEDIFIEAEAAFVFDVATNRVLFEKNPDEVLPLASITKLMTALLAYEIVDEAKTVQVPVSAVRQEGDSGLYAGESFSLRTLADYALMSSSNDAAYTLAASAGSALFAEDGADAFVKGMNIRANELGLSTLKFYNPTGLDVSKTQPGAVGSARDVSFLLSYILVTHPDLLDSTQDIATFFYNEAGEYHESENTNELVTTIPNLIGSKTGYTDLAGGNLTIAFAPGLNRPIVITVLGSSINGRFTDTNRLVEETMRAITKHSSKNAAE